jgi:hypothetical protein
VAAVQATYLPALEDELVRGRCALRVCAELLVGEIERDDGGLAVDGLGGSEFVEMGR